MRPRRMSSRTRLRDLGRDARRRAASLSGLRRGRRRRPPGSPAGARRRLAPSAPRPCRARAATRRPCRRARRSRTRPRRSAERCARLRPSGASQLRSLAGRAPRRLTSARNSSTSRRSRALVHRLADDRAGGEQGQLGDLGAHVGEGTLALGVDLRHRLLAQLLDLGARLGDVALARLVGERWARARISPASRRASASTAWRWSAAASRSRRAASASFSPCSIRARRASRVAGHGLKTSGQTMARKTGSWPPTRASRRVDDQAGALRLGRVARDRSAGRAGDGQELHDCAPPPT